MTVVNKRYVLGIDLGTTNTLCAAWFEGDRGPEIIPIRQPTGINQYDFKKTLPSAVLLKNGRAYVGDYPKYEARFGPAGVITSIKREMGTPWVYEYDNRRWTPDQIAGCILRAVREGINVEVDLDDEPERVVITVPACFGVEQRRATLRAAQLAGFRIETIDLFDEPTAALLHDTWQRKADDSWGQVQRVMVLDIGGGTLDVSCMSLLRDQGVLRADVLGRSRFNELAGDDFDLNLAGLLLARYETEKNLVLDQLPEEVRRQVSYGLICAAEAAKLKLSESAMKTPPDSQDRLEAPVTVIDQDRQSPYFWSGRVRMADLGAALRPFFQREADADARLISYSFYSAIDECLESLRTTGISDPDRPPDHVFLAGGSASLPFIKDVVSRHFQAMPGSPRIVPQLVDRPMEAVALGAALYAGSQARYQGSESIELTQRMHEGIYLLTASGRPQKLVDPGAILPIKDELIDRDFAVGTSERLEINLATGNSEFDTRMQPFGSHIVELSDFVTSDSTIRLRISVDSNRDCQLTCEADVKGQKVTGQVKFHNGLDWQTLSDIGRPLPPVNPPVSGAAP